MDKNNVCMIIPYFGKFPESFNLYLYSCSKVNIDFYFFTDCELPDKVYKNTHFIKSSYEDYCHLVSKKLNINFEPIDRYNLVKIRPFLGIIHEDICSQYLFWGYSDIDLIYGTLMNKLITPQKLKKYNLITTHSARVAGHFTIIKTKSRYTSICKKIPNWKEKLETEKNIPVDEADFTLVVNPAIRYMYIIYSKIIKKLGGKKYRDEIFQVMQNLYRVVTNYDCLFNEYYTSPSPKKGQVWKYDVGSGKLISPENNSCKELVYLHFLFFKKSRYSVTATKWHKGFYAVPHNYSFKKNEIILISWKGIKIISDNEEKIVNN